MRFFPIFSLIICCSCYIAVKKRVAATEIVRCFCLIVVFHLISCLAGLPSFPQDGSYKAHLCEIKWSTFGDAKMLQAPLGGDCNEGVKARPGQDVTMRIKVFLLHPHQRQ